MAVPLPSAPEDGFADLILQHTTDAVLITTPEETAVWLNPGFERMFGWRLQDFEGRNPVDLLRCPDTAVEVTEAVLLAISERRPYQLEVRNMQKNGQPLCA